MTQELEFKDISSEKQRKYTFPGGDVVVIDRPSKLNVSDSGGHRVLDLSGVSHYVPAGWIHLEWTVFEGKPNFSF